MATILFGLVVLALVLWALNAFAKVNPQTAAVVLKTGGGLGALAVAGVLGVRGRLDIAIPLGLTGLGLLGWLPWSIPITSSAAWSARIPSLLWFAIFNR